MKRKIIALIMAALLIMSFAGCKKESAPETDGAGNNDTDQTDTKTYTDEATTLTIPLEGTEETVEATKHTDTQTGCELIYDNAFTAEHKQDSDSYTVLADDGTPTAYYSVTLSVGYTAADLKAGLIQQNEITEDNITEATVGDGYPAEKLTKLIEEDGVLTAEQTFYIVSNGDKLYLIETYWIIEAAEGFGARIDASLKTLKFLK